MLLVTYESLINGLQNNTNIHETNIRLSHNNISINRHNITPPIKISTEDLINDPNGIFNSKVVNQTFLQLNTQLCSNDQHKRKPINRLPLT